MVVAPVGCWSLRIIAVVLVVVILRDGTAAASVIFVVCTSLFGWSVDTAVIPPAPERGDDLFARHAAGRGNLVDAFAAGDVVDDIAGGRRFRALSSGFFLRQASPGVSAGAAHEIRLHIECRHHSAPPLPSMWAIAGVHDVDTRRRRALPATEASSVACLPAPVPGGPVPPNRARPSCWQA